MSIPLSLSTIKPALRYLSRLKTTTVIQYLCQIWKRLLQYTIQKPLLSVSSMSDEHEAATFWPWDRKENGEEASSWSAT